MNVETPPEPKNDASRDAPRLVRKLDEETWCLSWSRKQGCLHVEPIWDHVATNFAMLRGELPVTTDFVLLYTGTQAECGDMGKRMRSDVDAMRKLDGLDPA